MANLDFVCDRSSFSFENSERQEELEDVVDDLNPAEDGEAGEKTHRASNQAKGCLHRHLHIMVAAIFHKSCIRNYLHILFYLIKGCCVKVDLDHLQRSEVNFTS